MNRGSNIITNSTAGGGIIPKSGTPTPKVQQFQQQFANVDLSQSREFDPLSHQHQHTHSPDVPKPMEQQEPPLSQEKFLTHDCK